MRRQLPSSTNEPSGRVRLEGYREVPSLLSRRASFGEPRGSSTPFPNEPSTPCAVKATSRLNRVTSSRAKGSCRATVPLIQQSALRRAERSLLRAALLVCARWKSSSARSKRPSEPAGENSRHHSARRRHEFGHVQSPATGHAGVLQRQERPAHG